MTDSSEDRPRQAPRRRRRGGGHAGNTRSGGPAIHQLPWTLPVNTDHPVEPLPPEGVAAIHDGAMRILEEIGIQFMNLEAVEILRKAGCTVSNVSGESALVKMDRNLVMEKVSLAPASFDITPRNPDRRITIGSNHLLFTGVASPPNCSDLERGRRIGNRESFRELINSTAFICMVAIRLSRWTRIPRCVTWIACKTL